MNGKLLERCFVNLIDTKIRADEKRYPSLGKFAEAAFPDDANPVKKWQSIRNGQNGKPRNVSISEAYALAMACGENLARLLVEAEIDIKRGWTLDNDVFNQPESSKPGRPRKTKSADKSQQPTIKGEEAEELSTGTDV